MILRAGLALKIVGSLVNGLMPFRAFVAGFLTTTKLASPGTKKASVFLSSLVANFRDRLDDGLDVFSRYAVRMLLNDFLNDARARW